MKSESADHLAKTEQCLRKAVVILAIAATEPVMAESAAREAYYAAFHAAKALIFEKTSRVHKTHGGVHAEFNRMLKDDPGIASELRGFLIKAYGYKSTADYGTGPSATITLAEAKEAFETAQRFVEAIRGLIDA